LFFTFLKKKKREGIEGFLLQLGAPLFCLKLFCATAAACKHPGDDWWPMPRQYGSAFFSLFFQGSARGDKRRDGFTKTIVTAVCINNQGGER